jgi:PrtD family type I secretion system ABC transporter
MLPAVTRRWGTLNDGALLSQFRAGGVGGTFGGATKLTRQLVQTATLGAGAWLVIDQHVTPGVMVAATVILGRALAPIETLVAGWRALVEARAARRSLRELLSQNKEEPRIELPAPAGHVEAERVTFAFPRGERPVLRGVSFSLRAGESLGVIGPSASGKSTLLRLVLGVWKPTSGTLRLDGADASTWPREHLGMHVGYVPQDVELFAGTVAENIARLAEPDAAAVVRAAQRAHAHAMILRLPNGYDTEIGDGGQGLSPGQRQRIALARALYGDPRLVVLDEPNANLDHEGDEALVATVDQLKASQATVLIVAHRPALLRGVDKLLVLREGAVELFGPRGAVMARVARPVKEVA